MTSTGKAACIVLNLPRVVVAAVVRYIRLVSVHQYAQRIKEDETVLKEGRV